jgi:hypothetical protein
MLNPWAMGILSNQQHTGRERDHTDNDRSDKAGVNNPYQHSNIGPQQPDCQQRQRVKTHIDCDPSNYYLYCTYFINVAQTQQDARIMPAVKE